MVAQAIAIHGAFPATGNTERLRPTLLELKDQAFMERLLSQLPSAQGREALREQVADTRTDDGTLRLFQAVHRLFTVALLDVSCDRLGDPRLDPRQILSSGLVVRRVGEDGLQGWMRDGGEIVGWKRLPGELDGYDVDPALRRSRRLGSNHKLLRRLAVDDPGADYTEHSSSLFAAPPQVGEAAKRTYLYGLVSLTSSEQVEGAPPAQAPFGKEDIRARLPALLAEGGDGRSGLPPTATLIDRSMRRDPGKAAMFRVLGYLAEECGLFAGGASAEALRGVLQGIGLSGWGNLYAFLEQAHDILLGQPEDPDQPPPGATRITTPESWPHISQSVAADIVEAIEAAMQGRWSAMAPREGRFDGRENRYVVQCFIRVAGAPGCPPRTLWTEPTEPFEIVPWYESSDAVPPTVVELPDVTKDALEKLKPNVAFKVPESIQKIMDKLDVKALMDGEEPAKSSWGFGMICGFSIPLITICAFIVLQIFIGLLNLAFWWIAYIRICIPFPKKN